MGTRTIARCTARHQRAANVQAALELATVVATIRRDHENSEAYGVRELNRTCANIQHQRQSISSSGTHVNPGDSHNKHTACTSDTTMTSILHIV